MFKKVSMVLMIAMLVIILSGLAQAARIPGPGDQFVIKSGTVFSAAVVVIGVQPTYLLLEALEDTTVTVVEMLDGFVAFEYKGFPHNCPRHGRELVDIVTGGIPFSYFEENPEAFSPKN
ncbi:MAG TPA: hypothetical protein VMW10_11595 [Alphaproteobacteria bacterium]|nr:hypothetical protein [Alphaproteobacteria bacterium]